MKLPLVIAAGLSLAACTSVEALRPDMHAHPLPSRLDEIAYINGLRKAYVVDSSAGCFRGEGLKSFRPKFVQGYRDFQENEAALSQCVMFDPMDKVTDVDRKKRVQHYLDNGFGLTDLYCDRFFIVAAETRQSRQIQRNTGSAVDTLVTGVLTALGAGQSGLGILNHGFETFDATYKNIDSAFLVAPDRDDLLAVVQAAQDKIRSDARNKPPGSYAEARSFVERYASTCTFDGMRALVSSGLQQAKKTLKDATDKPAATATATTPPAAAGTTQDSGKTAAAAAEKKKDADLIASSPAP